MTVLFFALLGAIFGSFNNVVIYRLPRMMRGDALSLSWPPSFCPHCQQPIKARYNVPLLGWLWLKGRSRCCHQRISLRYPAVELGMALLFAAWVWQHSIALPTLLDLALLTLMVAMLFIDYEHLLLPNKLTVPFILLAMFSAFARQPTFATLNDIALGGAIGFLMPWLVNRAFALQNGRAGLGMGDIKLFAGIGAWQGWQALFHIMLIASLLGLVSGLVLFRAKRNEAFPFGPAIIIASVGWLFFQNQ
ncbi:prepilin peptidase [Kosakonia sp. BYX6]|uniref:Prepilin leader peptidase/N-methyltransferase n=1 Tax=Kosakonia calanthes TaxID=3139408 RepID=A0ABZ3B1X3_9ENTR